MGGNIDFRCELIKKAKFENFDFYRFWLVQRPGMRLESIKIKKRENAINRCFGWSIALFLAFS